MTIAVYAEGPKGSVMVRMLSKKASAYSSKAAHQVLKQRHICDREPFIFFIISTTVMLSE